MRSRKLMRMYKVILLILVMVSGCAVPTTQVTIQMTATTGLFPEATHTYPVGATATLTTTQTLPPKQPTLSDTPTKTLLSPTSTPQPTLNVSQAKELLQGFLQNNAGCRLPCIWGITPGMSDLDTLDRILSPFNDVSIPNYFYIHKRTREASGTTTFILWKENISVPIGFSHYNTGTSIEYLTLDFEAHRESGEGVNLSIKAVYGDPFFLQTLAYYQLPNILVEYGPPEEVLIAPFPDDPQYPPDTEIPFSIVLVYKKQGIFLEYISPRDKSGQYFVGCPAKVGYLRIIVWNPKQAVPLIKIVDLASGVGINSLNIHYFQSIDVATKMTLADFYQRFLDPDNTECIETLKNIWQ